MSTQKNASPVIIKRKKVVAGDGHHGGAWKVAIAFPCLLERFALVELNREDTVFGVVLTVANLLSGSAIRGGCGGTLGQETLTEC